MGAQGEPFNPLNRLALAESVVNHLMSQAPGPMPPEHAFVGAGVYAIYYVGETEPYEEIAREDAETPIYVGKAIPPGGRIGGFDLGAGAGPVLYNRVRQHARSLEQVGLPLEDFRCRHLVVEDIWVPLAEQLMISRYRPLWNHVVFGFGNHDPGSTRYNQARPLWDELHPGRPWAAKMQPAERTPDEISELIAAHLAGEDVSEELGEPEE
jgi:hypothetical protein